MRRTAWALAAASALLLAACSGGSAEDLVASAKAQIEKRDWTAATLQLKSALQKTPDNSEARLLLGQALLESGDAAGAVIELRKAEQLGATAANVQPLIARSLLAQGQLKQILQQFDPVTLPPGPASAELKTYVATALLAEQKLARAIALVDEALGEVPGHVPATLLKAQIEAAGGDFPRAMALLGEVLQKDAQHLNALLLKAEVQRVGLRDNDAAMATYTQAADAHPQAVGAHATLIGMLLQQGKTEPARARFETMRKAVPQHPETRLIEAQFAYIDKNFNRTRELTDALLRDFPNDMRLLQLAGVTALRLNALSQAEAHLSKVMSAQPNALAPRLLLARIHIRSGQPTKASEVLRPVIDSPQADANSLTLAGEAALQSGDAARAETLFSRAAKADPKATTARAALALGQVARGNAAAGFAELEAVAAADTGIRSDMALVAARMSTNDIDGALKAIAVLEKKQPDGPIGPALRGRILLQRKDTAGAQTAFELALKNDPLFFAATAGLAAIELAAGRPEGAEKRFRDLLVRDPRNTQALLGLAELKARTGGTKDELTAAIRAALDADPTRPGPRLLLVNHLLTNKEFNAAVTAAQEAAAALPDQIDVVDALGRAQLAAGQHEQAISTFNRLASLRPDRPEPEMRVAEAHLANSDAASARRSLDRALVISPDYALAYLALAQIAVRGDNPREAVAVARRLQTRAPRSPAGWLLEADVELSRQQAELALVPLRKAIDLGAGADAAIKLHNALAALKRDSDATRMAGDWTKARPRDVAFRYYLGDRALAASDYAGAESHYRSVLQIQPENAAAMNNVAWLLAQQKRPGALVLAEKANELLPNQPALMDTLAWVLALEKQIPRALELQKQAMAKAPQDQSLRLTLAKIYLQGGDKGQARTELQALAGLGDKFSKQAEVAQLLGTL